MYNCISIILYNIYCITYIHTRVHCYRNTYTCSLQYIFIHKIIHYRHAYIHTRIWLETYMQSCRHIHTVTHIIYVYIDLCEHEHCLLDCKCRWKTDLLKCKKVLSLKAISIASDDQISTIVPVGNLITHIYSLVNWNSKLSAVTCICVGLPMSWYCSFDLKCWS